MKKIQAPFSQPLAIDDDPNWGKWTAEDKRDNQGLSSSSCFLAGATETLDVIPEAPIPVATDVIPKALQSPKSRRI